MKISIIIPTHNRASLLKTAIQSIIKLKDRVNYEIIIVDNNSSDNTRKIVQDFKRYIRYIYEGKTSFSKARNTGVQIAKGEILLFIDDDVLINQKSLIYTLKTFQKYPKTGIVTGQILPKFIDKPPLWTMECQKIFNGWSLYNNKQISGLAKTTQEVDWAAGPFIAIKRSVYDLVGGFPPDTIGVETNNSFYNFRKLYIGPGDYGLCHKVRNAGYTIRYSSKISVFHQITRTRLTVDFWRSRVIGEGYHQAISQRAFFKKNAIQLYIKRLISRSLLRHNEKKLISLILKTTKNNLRNKIILTPEELWIRYHKAYLDMDYVLRKYPKLTDYLWFLGETGIGQKDYQKILRSLPNEYINLISDNLVYQPEIINDVQLYNQLIKNRGYYFKDLTILENNSFLSIINIIIDYQKLIKIIIRKKLT